MHPQTLRILYAFSPREREMFHAIGGGGLLEHIPPAVCTWHRRPTLADGEKVSERRRQALREKSRRRRASLKLRQAA